jgi:hypothetical protein
MSARCGGWGVAAALLCLGLGCGKSKEVQEGLDAAPHYIVIFSAKGIPPDNYGTFKKAYEAKDKEGAKKGRDAVESSVKKIQKELAELKPHPWQAAQQSDEAAKALLDAFEKVAIPEMDKLLKLMDEPTSPERDEQEKDAFRKINTAIYSKLEAADRAANGLQLEIAIAGGEKK